jgi:hypothetical protein
MKLKRIITVTMAGALMASAAQAVHIWQDAGAWSSTVFTYSTAPRYTGNELSLDMFGSFTHTENSLSDLFDTNIKRGGQWGGGVGINYFFTPWLGIGSDINFSDHRDQTAGGPGHEGGPFADYVMGNAILRLPLCNSGFAPYVFGGGGRGFNPHYEWLADLGVGLEYRITPGFGIFSDGRYIWHDHDSTAEDPGRDRLLLRAGIRLVF